MVLGRCAQRRHRLTAHFCATQRGAARAWPSGTEPSHSSPHGAHSRRTRRMLSRRPFGSTRTRCHVAPWSASPSASYASTLPAFRALRRRASERSSGSRCAPRAALRRLRCIGTLTKPIRRARVSTSRRGSRPLRTLAAPARRRSCCPPPRTPMGAPCVLARTSARLSRSRCRASTSRSTVGYSTARCTSSVRPTQRRTCARRCWSTCG